MQTLYCMVGLPGSGKTDYAKRLAKDIGAELISLSDIRKEMNSHGITDESVVYNTFDRKIRDNLLRKDCVVDSTGTKYKNRMYLFNRVLFDMVLFKKVCIIMATPYLECLKRCKVSKYTTEAYHDWQTPCYWEGWDEIWLHYERPEWMGLYGPLSEYINAIWDYDQGSSHHTLGLGEHMSKTSMLVRNELYGYENEYNNIRYKTELAKACLVHDCGKPLTKTFKESGEAQYYNHHHVGGYEAFFFDYNGAFSDIDGYDIAYISALVCYHMEPFFWNGSKKAEERFIRRCGRTFFDDIMRLHRADKRSR